MVLGKLEKETAYYEEKLYVPEGSRRVACEEQNNLRDEAHKLREIVNYVRGLRSVKPLTHSARLQQWLHTEFPEIYGTRYSPADENWTHEYRAQVRPGKCLLSF